jgi:transcriptional regulator with XRE-family HTH domain
MSNTLKSLGEQIRNRRLAEGWSQSDLAQQAGISRPHLSRIERGEVQGVTLRTVEDLLTALGIPLSSALDARGPRWKALPPGLGEFAKRANLPEGDVDMLARIVYRGRQPSTPEAWAVLYNVIQTLTQQRVTDL